jgi:hypothetical protein
MAHEHEQGRKEPQARQLINTCTVPRRHGNGLRLLPERRNTSRPYRFLACTLCIHDDDLKSNPQDRANTCVYYSNSSRTGG